MTKEKPFQTPSAVSAEAMALFDAAGPIPHRSTGPATIDRVLAETGENFVADSAEAEQWA